MFGDTICIYFWHTRQIWDGFEVPSGGVGQRNYAFYLRHEHILVWNQTFWMGSFNFNPF